MGNRARLTVAVVCLSLCAACVSDPSRIAPESASSPASTPAPSPTTVSAADAAGELSSLQDGDGAVPFPAPSNVRQWNAPNAESNRAQVLDEFARWLAGQGVELDGASAECLDRLFAALPPSQFPRVDDRESRRCLTQEVIDVVDAERRRSFTDWLDNDMGVDLSDASIECLVDLVLALGDNGAFSLSGADDAAARACLTASEVGAMEAAMEALATD